jgi:hypothetical protein
MCKQRGTNIKRTLLLNQFFNIICIGQFSFQEVINYTQIPLRIKKYVDYQMEYIKSTTQLLRA